MLENTFPSFVKRGEGRLLKMLLYNTKLKKYSQEPRKNMTDAERLLWSKMRNKQLKVYRFTGREL